MQIDIRTLLGRLNPASKLAMEQSAELCVQQTHYNVEIEHLLVRLLEADAPDVTAILERFEVSRDALQGQLQKTLDGFKRGIDDTLGDRLLAVEHDAIHELRQGQITEAGIGENDALFWATTTGHR